MRSPQSQEARQSDRQARNLRISIVVGLIVILVVAGAILWWPGTPVPAPVAGDAPVASGETEASALMTSAGEALKDQGTIDAYAVAAADKALDLTLAAGAGDDPRAIAQATCDSLKGKVEPGWRVRVFAPDGAPAAADCSI